MELVFKFQLSAFKFSYFSFPMPSIPGLLSPHASIEGLAYFPRMLSKIRLHAAGKLPQEYVPYLGDAFAGKTFDSRCHKFLGVSYKELVERTLEGGSDAEILAWARSRGKNPSAEQIAIWSAYATKRGWRDDGAAQRANWASEEGFDPEAILTFFDLIDVLEGIRKATDFIPEPFHPGPFTVQHPTIIPGLPSPYEETGGLVYFPRMIAKITLAAEGKLPEAWAKARGSMGGDRATVQSFDAYCCRFLGINYEELESKVLGGETDPSTLLAWALDVGTHPNADEITIWSTFLRKRGWRDEYTHRLIFRLEEAGIPGDAVRTMFDYIDLDEGHPLRSQ